MIDSISEPDMQTTLLLDEEKSFLLANEHKYSDLEGEYIIIFVLASQIITPPIIMILI